MRQKAETLVIRLSKIVAASLVSFLIWAGMYRRDRHIAVYIADRFPELQRTYFHSKDASINRCYSFWPLLQNIHVNPSAIRQQVTTRLPDSW